MAISHYDFKLKYVDYEKCTTIFEGRITDPLQAEMILSLNNGDIVINNDHIFRIKQKQVYFNTTPFSVTFFVKHTKPIK